MEIKSKQLYDQIDTNDKLSLKLKWGHMGFFENKFDVLSKLLRNTGAVIAGGSVLSCFTSYDSGINNDFDFYVNIENAVALQTGLRKAGFIININKTLAPAYDQSFFRKNHILARFRYAHSAVDDLFIDIMILPNDIKPQQVVTNFDLTFCEIWFDGKKVLTPKGNKVNLLAKQGRLKEEYTESLLKYLNVFIIKRLKKYAQRGFTITYGDYKCCPTIIVPKKKSDPEEWVVKKIYQGFLQFFKIEKRVNLLRLFCDYPLVVFKMDNLKKVMSDVISLFGGKPTEETIKNLMIHSTYLTGVAEVMTNEIKDEKLPAKLDERFFTFAGFNLTVVNYMNYTDIVNKTFPDLERDYIIPEGGYEWHENILRTEPIINPIMLNTINIDEKKELPENCDDIMGARTNSPITLDKNKDGFNLTDTDNFLLASKHINSEKYDLICYSYEMLLDNFNNKSSKWMYECTGKTLKNKPRVVNNKLYTPPPDKSLRANLDKPYLNMVISMDNQPGLVPIDQVLSVLSQNSKVIYLIPRMIKGEHGEEQLQFTHTVSYANIYGSDMVSANHCQGGTTALVYDLKLCNDNNNMCNVSDFKETNNPSIRHVPLNHMSNKLLITSEQEDILEAQRLDALEYSILELNEDNLVDTFKFKEFIDSPKTDSYLVDRIESLILNLVRLRKIKFLKILLYSRHVNMITDPDIMERIHEYGFENESIIKLLIERELIPHIEMLKYAIIYKKDAGDKVFINSFINNINDKLLKPNLNLDNNNQQIRHQAFIQSVKNDDNDLFNVYLPYSDINYTDSDGKNALYYAILYKNDYIIQKLADYGLT